MIYSVEIAGYRSLNPLAMNGLGRINLLVGTNNSGKTSALEALYLGATDNVAMAMQDIFANRGECLAGDTDSEHPSQEYEVCHLFNGHAMKEDSLFSINILCDAVDIFTRFTAEKKFTPSGDARLFLNRHIDFRNKGDSKLSQLPSNHIDLTDRKTLIERRRSGQSNGASSENNGHFISASSLSGSELISLWSKIVLTDLEEQILKALRIVEPGIERIAALTTPKYASSVNRGGFMVKLAGAKSPVPIGSLGDGMWRMLAMAMALVRARDGMLLVDEIDTGLHFTVMTDMWKLIAQTARELNVQVFATTHSYDCVTSLATICDENAGADDHVTIQRIEPGRSKAVAYTEAEIKVAAERHIEVR
jgi:hypothetical protein